MSYKAPRGTRDIFGINVLKMNLLELKAREVFKKHGFEEVKTPIFEEASLFTRSIGQATDIVEKEMYIFEDKKGRKLALRPEGTASLARAFVEHRMDISNPVGRFFYIGEMFRYERPQAGRYRQFHQIGAEFYGNSSPTADAEIIVLAKDLLAAIGIDKISVNINSLGCEKCRPFFKEVLVKYFESLHNLCQDCQRRLKTNPLRLLDCKIDSYKFTEIPKISSCLCNSCKDDFHSVQSLLKSIGCAYTVDEKLVRGLDYYTRTIFEICSDMVGSHDAIAAGGRYDNLVKEIGGPNIPAVGFALGSERVLIAAQNIGFFNNFKGPEKIFIAIADQELLNNAFAFAMKIARYGFKGNKDISVFGPVNDKNLTSQLKFADKMQASKTIVFAREEFNKGKLLIKNMKNRTQEEVSISDV
ncbi:MAG: histidine--tRNA ligase [Endomicrobium sp.]|jgi:histidyl-tRNA synthetase|nr:histidine--tRNA ligase [Endomicrobium sp.]